MIDRTRYATARDAEQETGFSVGHVAEETGLSPDTLRIWERRYGRPVPERLPSGHRRYRFDQLVWLRQVAEALSLGHRPGKVLKASSEELRELLGDATPDGDTDDVERLLALVPDFRARDLATALDAAATSHSVVDFLDDVVGPFLARVGRAWADGELDVRHEHFASQIVEDGLRRLSARIDSSERNGLFLFATLPGEVHGLGVLMSSIVCAAAGFGARSLGTCTPPEELVRAAREMDATSVGVSVSLATAGVGTDRELVALRDALPASTELVVGGTGAKRTRRKPRGIRYLSTLGEFDAWLRG